tara:strand:+ start:159 stop:398 length:240 start_codon:yes stop_codon:yes gene_type:complete
MQAPHRRKSLTDRLKQALLFKEQGDAIFAREVGEEGEEGGAKPDYRAAQVRSMRSHIPRPAHFSLTKCSPGLHTVARPH